MVLKLTVPPKVSSHRLIETAIPAHFHLQPAPLKKYLTLEQAAHLLQTQPEDLLPLIRRSNWCHALTHQDTTYLYPQTIYRLIALFYRALIESGVSSPGHRLQLISQILLSVPQDSEVPLNYCRPSALERLALPGVQRPTS